MADSWFPTAVISHFYSAVYVGADNVRITPNRWISNDDLHKITLLLSEVGFVWLFTNISRCWIKFANGPPRITLAARKRATPV